MKFYHILCISLFLVLSSCKSREANNGKSELNYMQNIEEIATEASLKNAVSTIQPGDQLVILVSSKDIDVAKPFNQNWSSSESISNIQPGGNSAAQPQAISGPTYVVDTEGKIDFPIIGKLDTTGKTIEELKSELKGRITRYIINPTVSVRLANYKITVLGEVARPGQYTVADGHTTLLNALGLAGDVTLYAKRDDVLVVRNQDGQISKEKVNLTDASFINSPFYFLKQGDVVYVPATRNKEIAAKQNPNTGLYISVASVVLGLLGLLVTVFKK